MADIPTVAITELPEDFTDATGRQLIDVREDDEWARGHVAGALHIPLGDIPARLNEIELGDEVSIICHSGARAMRVLQYLAQVGVEGACVQGGMLAWSQAGRKVVTGGSPP